MEFVKYQHIERWGTDETEGIEFGEAYVFPKIDGTNASAWYDNGIKGGSRRRELTIENDNQGFYEYILKDERIHYLLKDFPGWRLYGEWLVPHTLKTYKKDAWRKFYIFDVMENDKYISYDDYKPILDKYNLDYIVPLAVIKNGNYENFINQLKHNVFLIEDGKGTGEGIVIKNYNYKNKYGRQIWAKIVTSEFKEKHYREGPPVVKGNKMIEEEIIEKYCTKALIDKTLAKIKNDNGGWTSKYIPQLLGRVYYDLIVEELWEIIKKYKNPTINFKTLNYFLVLKIKEYKKELF